MSFEIRRFFEDAAVAAPPASPVDVAAMMASSGIKTEADNPGIVPDIKIEEPKAIEPEVKAPVVAETETKAVKAEAKVDIPQPSSTPTAAVQAAAADWKQELKKADTSEILKELGFDDKMVGFFNKWRTDGKIDEYIKAVTMDYTKMSPEQLMKYQLQQRYPEFSAEDLEELYHAKVIEQYKLDPESNSETELKRGKLLLLADTKEIRERLIKEQKEYILSAKPPALQQADNSAQLQQEEQTRQAMDQYRNMLTQSQATKDLVTTKKLVIGEGADAFNYAIPEPDKIINALQDPMQWAQLVFEQDNSPKVDKQLLLSLIANDDGTFLKEYGKFHKSLGAKQAVEQIENVKKPEGTPSKSDEGPLTPAQALARQGVLTSND